MEARIVRGSSSCFRTIAVLILVSMSFMVGTIADSSAVTSSSRVSSRTHLNRAILIIQEITSGSSISSKESGDVEEGRLKNYEASRPLIYGDWTFRQEHIPRPKVSRRLLVGGATPVTPGSETSPTITPPPSTHH